MSLKTPHLFDGLNLSSQIKLKHRIVLAPLTRCRATGGKYIPHPLSIAYYSQRATKGGLLISEGTSISQQGRGVQYVPGIYTDEQVEGWKPVVEAVHARGGYFFMQLWHVGRASGRCFQPNNQLPVGPSAIASGGKGFTESGEVFDCPAPKELSTDEIKEVIGDFVTAAKNALAAGCDGVEIHSANGYLLDQFLHDGSNIRKDDYGGSIENRARFLFEVVEAVVNVFGGDASRVGVRLAPFGTFGGMKDSDEEALFTHVIEKLDQCGLSYIHLNESRWTKGTSLNYEFEDPAIGLQAFRKCVKKTPLMTAGCYHRTSAKKVVEEGWADLVAFGKLFISNPDLPSRLKLELPLTEWDRNTFYSDGAEGYIDYPYYTDQLLEEPKYDSDAIVKA